VSGVGLRARNDVRAAKKVIEIRTVTGYTCIVPQTLKRSFMRKQFALDLGLVLVALAHTTYHIPS
jgi:hypothetical protein